MYVTVRNNYKNIQCYIERYSAGTNTCFPVGVSTVKIFYFILQYSAKTEDLEVIYCIFSHDLYVV